MTPSIIFWAVCLGLTLALHFGACIAYGPRIQRYLESTGESPGFFGFSWSLHQDYFRARRIARQRGDQPAFLRRFALAEIIACAIFACGLIVLIVSEARGHTL